MTKTAEELRFALDDARRRHSAVVDLLASNDRQALSFLQLYVALAGGALSGGAAILFSTVTSFPRPLGFGLFGFAAPVVIGAVFCMIAVWPSDINLPGRKADFWIWANDVSSEEAYIAYLRNLAIKEAQNSDLNAKCGRFMLLAKLMGVAAPIAAIAACALAFRLGC